VFIARAPDVENDRPNPGLIPKSQINEMLIKLIRQEQ
jgi:hypothetical protein